MLYTSKIRQLQCIGHTSNLQFERFIFKKISRFSSAVQYKEHQENFKRQILC